MASITKSKFWIDLLKKVIKAIAKDYGIRTSPPTHVQHVVPYEDGWAVRGEGNKRVTASYDYQDDAIDRAKEIARNYESAEVIHRTDGTIRDRINYKK